MKIAEVIHRDIGLDMSDEFGCSQKKLITHSSSLSLKLESNKSQYIRTKKPEGQ